ncbi:MAG: hypothetical protein WKF30_11570 [Pyrinomonadaceae bacterium]
MERFSNFGYGWSCKLCASEFEAGAKEDNALARFFREGEAEEKEPRLSAPALAKWTDEKRQALRCPRCGIEERIG